MAWSGSSFATAVATALTARGCDPDDLVDPAKIQNAYDSVPGLYWLPDDGDGVPDGADDTNNDGILEYFSEPILSQATSC